MRGVTRPMAEKQIREHNKKMHSDEGQKRKQQDEQESHKRSDYRHESHRDGGKKKRDMNMSDDMRKQMLHMHHMLKCNRGDTGFGSDCFGFTIKG